MSKAAIIHKPCGGTAFLYDHAPMAGEKMDPALVTTVEGGKVPPGATGMRCSLCGQRLTMSDLAPGPMVYDMGDSEDMATIYGEYHGKN
jgi:hypothetical protein